MRIARVLCALFVAFSCVPAVASAQRDPALTAQRNPSLPPEGPGPLYWPKNEPPAVTPADLERLSREPSVKEGMRRQLREQAEQLRLAQQQPRPDDGFRPVSELPPEDRLPAAPMLVGAYVFVMLALFAYVVSLSRRLNAVSRDIVRIDAQLKQR